MHVICLSAFSRKAIDDYRMKRPVSRTIGVGDGGLALGVLLLWLRLTLFFMVRSGVLKSLTVVSGVGIAAAKDFITYYLSTFYPAFFLIFISFALLCVGVCGI